MAVTLTYQAGKWNRNDNAFPDDPGADLGPVWTEQPGSSQPLDSLQDSITNDGWERLLAWVQRR